MKSACSICSARGVQVGLALTKRLGAGFFGGEGFFLQKLWGDGLAFIHACGPLKEMELGPDETLRVDAGCLVGFQESVDYDIKLVGGIKTILFGGEGLFFAHLKGPGLVYVQTMPFSRLADRIIHASRLGNKGRG